MKVITKTLTVSPNGIKDISKTDFRKSAVGYEIARFEIENCLTERLINDLRVDKDNPLIHAGPGNVVFCVSGYDDDPREIYEIPEFAAYIRKANESAPCWLYYAAPESLWLLNVLFCVTKSAYVSGSRPGYRTLAFSPYEAAEFLCSQLDDCCELSIFAKVIKKKAKTHLKLVFEGFGIQLP